LKGVSLHVDKRITSSSIIGPHIQIVGVTERTTGYKLIIGEQSSAEV
jgi:hypothetical protein